MSSKEDAILPLEYESFKEDMKTLFSLSNKDLELIFNELKNKGITFSDNDIKKIVHLDILDAVKIKSLLTYIIPEIKENRERVRKELTSLELDIQKIDFFINTVSSFSNETYQTSQILSSVEKYLVGKKHIESIVSELNFAPIHPNGDSEILLLPLINIKIRTHQAYDDGPPEEISMTIDPKELQEIIDYLQNLLSSIQTEIKQLKDILGKKIIITLGDS